MGDIQTTGIKEKTGMEIIFYDGGFFVHDHFDVLTASEECFVGASVDEVLEEIGEYIEARII